EHKRPVCRADFVAAERGRGRGGFPRAPGEISITTRWPSAAHSPCRFGQQGPLLSRHGRPVCQWQRRRGALSEPEGRGRQLPHPEELTPLPLTLCGIAE